MTSVVVSCSTRAFTVGGTVAGLAGTGLDPAPQRRATTSRSCGSGSFAFAAPVPSGGTYAVTVAQQPTGPSQTCTVSSGSGSVGSGPVTGVLVTCQTDTFSVGGTVSGLAGSGLILSVSFDGGPGQDLPIASSDPFSFPQPGVAGSSYSVTVKTQPTSPWQTCSVAGGSGVVNGPVSTVAVSCATNLYAISGTISGYAGSGLVHHHPG